PDQVPERGLAQGGGGDRPGAGGPERPDGVHRHLRRRGALRAGAPGPAERPDALRAAGAGAGRAGGGGEGHEGRQPARPGRGARPAPAPGAGGGAAPERQGHRAAGAGAVQQRAQRVLGDDQLNRPGGEGGAMEETMERAGNFLPRLDQDPFSSAGVDRNVVTLTAPASVGAEQFRTLYFRLERLKQLRPLKVVSVTSAVPGEGKTVTALNLALAAARASLDR